MRFTSAAKAQQKPNVLWAAPQCESALKNSTLLTRVIHSKSRAFLSVPRLLPLQLKRQSWGGGCIYAAAGIIPVLHLVGRSSAEWDPFDARSCDAVVQHLGD